MNPFGRLATSFKPLVERLLRLEAHVAARWTTSAHRRLKNWQWSVPPTPEYFDHRLDLYHGWLASRSPSWLERGVLSGICLKGKRVLELACGDGFNTRNFYSLRSQQVVGCDANPRTIAAARRLHPAPNVTYEVADIRRSLPAGPFENVIIDSTIQYFSLADILIVIENVKRSMTPDGILSGSTNQRRLEEPMFVHHKHEFSSKEELAEFLSRFFRDVVVFETIYPSRNNLYFWCSDAELPFSESWEHGCRVTRAAAGMPELNTVA